MVIKNVCQEDVAEYACVALNVQTKTKLEAGKEGQDVKLSCKLNGPVEKVQWHKRGGFLVDEKLRYTKYTVDRGEDVLRIWIAYLLMIQIFLPTRWQHCYFNDQECV